MIVLSYHYWYRVTWDVASHPATSYILLTSQILDVVSVNLIFTTATPKKDRESWTFHRQSSFKPEIFLPTVAIWGERWQPQKSQGTVYPGSKTSNGCFRKWWYPQIIHFNRDFHSKSSILVYPYFWKHPHIKEHPPNAAFKGSTFARCWNMSLWWFSLRSFSIVSTKFVGNIFESRR